MKRILALIISTLCLAGGIAAKDNSVAYVDMAYILKNLPQYETANEQLTMMAKRWQKEVDALEQEIRVMTTNYQTEQIFLSEEMRQRREEEILQKEQEAIELKRKYFGEAGELVKKREALLKPIQDEIYAAIQELANEKHIDVIKEICGNTFGWSNAFNSQWTLGAKFEDNKVIFVALDLGNGILESLSRSFF